MSHFRSSAPVRSCQNHMAVAPSLPRTHARARAAAHVLYIVHRTQFQARSQEFCSGRANSFGKQRILTGRFGGYGTPSIKTGDRGPPPGTF